MLPGPDSSSSTQASSACRDGSTVPNPPSAACLTIAVMVRAESTMLCGTLEIRFAPWVGCTNIRFGNPRTPMPCRVRIPPAQYSDSEWPRNEPIPPIPGSFGTLSGPVPSTTNWAVSRSPRLVSMTQRPSASSQLSPVTSVWNSTSEYRPNWLPMRRQWARISGPCTYFSVGMCPVSSSSGR